MNINSSLSESHSLCKLFETLEVPKLSPLYLVSWTVRICQHFTYWERVSLDLFLFYSISFRILSFCSHSLTIGLHAVNTNVEVIVSIFNYTRDKFAYWFFFLIFFSKLQSYFIIFLDTSSVNSLKAWLSIPSNFYLL